MNRCREILARFVEDPRHVDADRLGRRSMAGVVDFRVDGARQLRAGRRDRLEAESNESETATLIGRCSSRSGPEIDLVRQPIPDDRSPVLEEPAVHFVPAGREPILDFFFCRRSAYAGVAGDQGFEIDLIVARSNARQLLQVDPKGEKHMSLMMFLA